VKAFGWSARANASWKVTPLLDLQAFTMYRAPQKTEQGRMSRFAMTNLSVRQKLRGDKATATLRVMDPFGTMGWTMRASDGRVIQLMDRRFGARGAFLSFNYNFGQAPKLRQRPPEESCRRAGRRGCRKAPPREDAPRLLRGCVLRDCARLASSDGHAARSHAACLTASAPAAASA
jgi:hypothetical protein